VVLAAVAVGAVAPSAMAQAKFDRLFVFGDSYADLTLANPLVTGQVGISFWNVYPVSLGQNLNIPNTEWKDFAVGGATASPNGKPGLPPFWNLPQQVEDFISKGNAFKSGDLITINIGGNDIRALLGNTASENAAFGYLNATINSLNAKDFAAVTTALVTQQIDRLIKANAQNFVLGSFSAISRLPELQAFLSTLPPPVAAQVAATADTYAKAYFDGMQMSLLPYAKAGQRFFMFDLARLGDAVAQDPAKYGFLGFMCVPPSCTSFHSPFYFGPDGLHLTDAGFDLVGKYMANIVEAPGTIAAQPGVVSATTSGFVQSVLGRLDSSRTARELAGSEAGPGATFSGGLTAYTMGSVLGGNRSDSSFLGGYDYDATSGTIGIELNISRYLILGVAGNYTTASADLNSGASIGVDAVQGAAYLSYATRQFFAEALAAYASHDVDLSRPGITDQVTSKTDATSVGAALRGGYLVEFGGLRVGPIAGVTYVRSKVDGYTESGDPLLTFSVSGQTLESIAGNLGLRFMAPFKVGSTIVVPRVDILLEHQFGDHTRTLTASLTQASLLPILTPVSDFDPRTYGRVEGGVTFQFSPEWSASINGGTTFDKDSARDYHVSGGLSFRF
jgi:outer membrane autotransporter protein